MWYASYDGYSYSAIAFGETEKEARRALIKEWNRCFDNEMTTEDWDESIVADEFELGDCIIT